MMNQVYLVEPQLQERVLQSPFFGLFSLGLGFWRRLNIFKS